jgi:1-acyl-sn-glycerol-3-phosphate acyltransferase
MSIVDVLRGDFVVDQWGCDPGVQDMIDTLIRPLLRIEVVGAENVPGDGPAVLVANRRWGVVEPAVIGRAVRDATGRRMRFVGLPDVAPLSTLLRRAGAVVNTPAEIASLLRAGHVVGQPLSVRMGHPPMAGNLAPDDMAAALDVRAPVLPVAAVGGDIIGRWRVYIGPPVPCPKARGPLALAELADSARNGVQALLDEATPPRWPWS